MSTATPATPGAGSRGAPIRLALILLVALAARLVALPGSTERTMDPDGAHLLNVARCFERGQGFSNPGAWPAWMKPERLPMPETFKEPAYSFTIAALARATGGEFKAGLLVSLLSGLLMTFATYLLARGLGFELAEALFAALLVAANPLAVFMSARITVDCLFPALLTLSFALAVWRPSDPGRSRAPWVDVATGACTGLAFMARGQTLLATPFILWLVVSGRRPVQSLRAAVLVLAAALASSWPFVLRNMRLFGTPFYSDVGEFGLWPYVDQLTFSHGLDRPPPPLAFALHHLPAVIHHMGDSAYRFFAFVLPGELAGNPVWLPALGIGIALIAAGRRRMLPIVAYVVVTLGFIFGVHWDSRYFTSTVPVWSLAIALGAVWIARALGPLALWGPLRGRHVLLAAALVTFVVQVETARRLVARFSAPEVSAAIAEAPFLDAHLARDESVMVVRTSFWSWFADRPSVHLVIADDARFEATLRRLKVKYAALQTSRLGEFAARYPGGTLPRSLVFDHADSTRDVTVFSIRLSDAP